MFNPILKKIQILLQIHLQRSVSSDSFGGIHGRCDNHKDRFVQFNPGMGSPFPYCLSLFIHLPHVPYWYWGRATIQFVCPGNYPRAFHSFPLRQQMTSKKYMVYKKKK